MAMRYRIGRLAEGLMYGYLLAAATTAMAEQLGRPAVERTWHGRAAGIPYDFRRPTLARLRAAWWDPRNPRLVVPRGDFGLGWAINVYRLYRLLRPRAERGGD